MLSLPGARRSRGTGSAVCPIGEPENTVNDWFRHRAGGFNPYRNGRLCAFLRHDQAVRGLGEETVAGLMPTAFEPRTRPDGSVSLTDEYRLLIARA